MSSEPEGAARARNRVVLLGVVLLAVLLRVEYLRELIGSPFWQNLLLDAEWYDQMARHVTGGVALASEQAYFRPPLYPLFLAGLYALFGPGPVAPRLVQMLLGILHVWLCWRVALRTHGERVATVTAVLAATYGMFIYFEAEILTTTLGTVLTTAATLLLLEADHRSSARLAAGSGIAIGLAAITHATALVLAPVAAVWALRRRRGLGIAAALLAGVALPVGIVTGRNVAASGELVLIATQGGVNFYVGNNPDSDGKSALAPGYAEANQVIRDPGIYRDTVAVAARTLAERELGRRLSSSAVDRFWYAKGLAWMREHPKDALAHLFRKFVFFWNGFEHGNNRNLRDQARRFTPLLQFFLVQFSFLLPFALFGMLRGGTRNRATSLLSNFLVVYSVAIAAFFVCARFRQPAVPWLLPFGAAGVLAFVDDLRRARLRPRRFGTTGAVLVALFAITNATLVTRAGIADVTTQKDAPFHRYNLAVLFEQEGNLDRAIEEYRAAAASGVPDPRIHLNLGNLLARTGRAEDAREEYRRVLRIAPDYETSVRSNLGVLAARQGDWTESIRQFEACLAVDPAHAKALLGVATAYLSAGRFDEAAIALRRALAARAGPEPALRRSLGLAYLETGLLEDAERESLAALRLDPKDVVAVLNLGKIYRLQGKPEAAERMWAKARRMAPGVPAVERAILEAQATEE